MYSTCLFCNGALGSNEAVEAFPVGRRLAFDGAKGRLWVVCRRCERWNLTPLEERWEAIEQCERAFRDTRLRVSTDEIGMARLKDGLELVRIGAPQRPEMAAWRYGDQFGRRRRRSLIVGGATAAAVTGYVIAGPIMGLVTVSIWPGINVYNFVHSLYRRRSVAARIPRASGEKLVVSREELEQASLGWDARERRWSVQVQHRLTEPDAARWWQPAREHAYTTLGGDEALTAARLLLPVINARGAPRGTVQEAVEFLGETPAVDAIFARAARSFPNRSTEPSRHDATVRLKTIPTPVRLALEMAAHEESERRALEGELHLLEAAWRDAEEIAGIADDMFLPQSVNDELKRLKDRSRESG
jgi:hypothetical protein